ncbi:MAG: hypothetical protein CSA63_01470 [Propionibacterium sp.]|nr:MAG: hypothetical protein CSA63_01470 [Propionibacterium sp.]
METFRTLIRRIGWYRRPLAAAFAGLSILLLGIWLKAPPAGVPVVVLSADQTATEPLSEADLQVRLVPPELTPTSAITDISAAVGRRLRQAMPADTIIVAELLSDATLEAGRAVAPIFVADPQLRSVLSPGLRVSLVLADETGVEVITSDARIASSTVAPHADDGLVLQQQNSALVLVDVPQEIAPQISALGQSGQLGILITG